MTGVQNYLDRERPVPRPRILVADDVPAVCRSLSRLLSWAEVIVADGGTDPYLVCMDAVRRVTQRFDLLIVDGLEGYGATVADIAHAEGVPVIAYTSEPGPFRRLPVRVVEKPGKPGELVAAVRAVIGEEATTHAADAAGGRHG